MSEDSLLFLNPKSDKLQILYLRDDFTCGNIPIADAIIGAHTEIVVSGCIDFKSKKVIVDEDDDNAEQGVYIIFTAWKDSELELDLLERVEKERASLLPLCVGKDAKGMREK